MERGQGPALWGKGDVAQAHLCPVGGKGCGLASFSHKGWGRGCDLAPTSSMELGVWEVGSRVDRTYLLPLPPYHKMS